MAPALQRHTRCSLTTLRNITRIGVQKQFGKNFYCVRGICHGNDHLSRSYLKTFVTFCIRGSNARHSIALTPPRIAFNRNPQL
jgi:hypothetical protein